MKRVGQIFTIALLIAIAMLSSDAAFAESIQENSDLTDYSDEPDESAAESPPDRYYAIRGGLRLLAGETGTNLILPYQKPKTSPVAGFGISSMSPELKLSVASSFIDEDDYHADFLFDGGGNYRFHLETEALWHNIAATPLPPATPGFIAVNNQYGGNLPSLKIKMNNFDSRIKAGSYPFHLNSGFFQQTREGSVETRIADFSFNDRTGGTLYQLNKKINQETREGRIGFDGRFGFIIGEYGFRIRDFSSNGESVSIPLSASAGGASLPGVQSISTTPDTRLTAHTFKLLTDMSGGLAASSAYSYMERSNEGSKSDAIVSSRPSETLQAISGDIRYTISRDLTTGITYRRRQVDRDSSQTVYDRFLQIPAAGTVPPGMTSASGLLIAPSATSSIRDTVSAFANYRIHPALTLRLEYKGELESRSSVADHAAPNDPTARYNDSRQTHSALFSGIWKPVKTTKINFRYSYSECDNPAYAASFAKRHLGEAGLAVSPGRRWGVTARYSGIYDITDSVASNSRLQPRESITDTLNAALWISPVNRFTISANYGYISNRSEQQLLFTTSPAETAANSTYSAAANSYGIDMLYILSEKIDLSASFMQIFSRSSFNIPATASVNLLNNSSFSTAGITELSALDSTDTSLSVRSQWRFSKNYGVTLEYSFRKLNEHSASGDALAHSVMTIFTGHWQP